MSARGRTVVFAAAIAALLSIAISSAPAKEAPAPGPAEGNSLFGQRVVPGEVIVRFERGASSSDRAAAKADVGCHPRAQAPAAPHPTGAGGAWPGAGGRLEARARPERRLRGTEPGRSCRRHAQRHALHGSLGPQQHRPDGGRRRRHGGCRHRRPGGLEPGRGPWVLGARSRRGQRGRPDPSRPRRQHVRQPRRERRRQGDQRHRRRRQRPDRRLPWLGLRQQRQQPRRRR